MTEFTSWEDVRAQARRLDPGWDDPDRVEQRRLIREELLASATGARLAEIRERIGLTRAELGKATGLTRVSISRIENGQPVSLDAVRVYVTGLGGQVEVIATFDGLRLNVARARRTRGRPGPR